MLPGFFSAFRAVLTSDGLDDPAAGAKADRRIAWSLFAVALAVRVVSAARVQVIAQDGVRFISMAKLFAAGEFGEALKEAYHPLYPLSIAIFRPFAGGYESSALAISVVASSLGVLALWGFARPLFGRRSALTTCVCYCFLPHFVRPGADTLSEGVFLTLLLTSICAGAAGIRDKRTVMAMLGGAAAGAAYLTRPEGVGILMAFGATTAVLLTAGVEGQSRARIAASGLLVLAGFLLAAGPYLGYIRATEHRWDLSRKKTVASLTESLEEKIEEGKEVSHPDSNLVGAPGAVAILARELTGNLYFVPAGFVLLGLAWPWRGRRRPWRWELPTLFASAAWLCAGFILLRGSGYLSHRHTLPAALFLLGHAGRGAVLFSDGAASLLHRIPAWGRRSAVFPATLAVLAFLLLFAAVAGIPENFRPYRLDKLFEKEIGREAAALVPEGASIAGDLPRVSYYAGRRHVVVPLKCGFAQLLALAQDRGFRLLIVDAAHIKSWAPEIDAALADPDRLPPGFRLEREWNAGPRGDKAVRAYSLRLD